MSIIKEPALSILICTVVGREVQFENLHNILTRQAHGLPVEILFEKDNKEISVGAKRQILLERATGKKVSFIDDDDLPAADYCDAIVEAIRKYPNVDCIGFQIECSGTPGRTASASNRYDDWAENQDGFDYVRTIYHKTPVDRKIALAIGYKDMRFSEDADFSKRLKESGLLKTEHYIDRVMYYYRYKHEHHSTKYGIKS